MTDIIPTVGRIVLYMFPQHKADAVNALNAVGCVHNHVKEGDVYPAVVVRTWGDTATSAVNLKVLLDGQSDLWVTSVTVGDGPGNFSWMPYQKAVAAGAIAPTLHATAPAPGASQAQEPNALELGAAARRAGPEASYEK